METKIAQLCQDRVFYHFYQISQIPHGSGNEKALSDYVLNWAKSLGLEAEQDESAYAAYLLGRIFMCGEIVPKDIPEAIRHFEIASVRGNHCADYRLGQIYLFEPDFFDMDAALEHLNRSAQAGNESAAMALQRMAENSFLAITTNVLDLVGGLCDIEPRRQVKDCTTMPQKRERRKWEQRM